MVGFLSIFLFVANFIFSSVMVKKSVASFVIVFIIQSTPIFIAIYFVFSNNKLYDDRQKDTEEKIKQNQKFESCFDNVKESIILI